MRRMLVMTMVMAAAILAGAAKLPQERVVDGDGIVDAQLNGEPVRIRVDPAAPGIPLISKALAERRGLKMSKRLGIGFYFGVGPIRVAAPTATVKMAYGGRPETQRIGWVERLFSTGAEGTVGPAGLPDPVVRFVLHPTRPGERTVTFPMEKLGFPMTMFGGGWVAATAMAEVGGEPMRIRFDPGHARTVATAGAAVRLAQAYEGRLSGETVPTEISFGVERPVRTLALARAFAVGPWAIERLGARTGDDGSTRSIRDGDAAAAAADPDEIVVTARRKRRDVRRDIVTIGADQLSRCSSIVFDKPAHVILLTCI